LAKRLARHGLAVSGGALAAVLGLNAASATAPTSAMFSTLKAASLIAAGQAAAAGVISAQVAALTEGVLKAMSMTKVKIVAAFLLALLVVGAGAGVLSHAAQGQPRPGGEFQSVQPATAKEDHLKNTLLALDKALWDAVAKGEPAAVQKLYADDFVSFSQYGRFNKKQSVDSVPNYRCSEIQIRDVELHRVTKQVAILTYIYSTRVLTPSGKLDGVRRDHRISYCWTQRDGGWVVVSINDIVLQGGE
jgi:ketosteroid isomerase-like protein